MSDHLSERWWVLCRMASAVFPGNITVPLKIDHKAVTQLNTVKCKPYAEASRGTRQDPYSALRVFVPPS